jgi:hypothetical protein
MHVLRIPYVQGGRVNHAFIAHKPGPYKNFNLIENNLRGSVLQLINIHEHCCGGFFYRQDFQMIWHHPIANNVILPAAPMFEALWPLLNFWHVKISYFSLPVR